MVELGWRPGFILIGVRVSAISCFEVSSRQTNGRLPSRGRV
jgi:PIN domain nuclease of toxin-antitoxin system